MGRYYRYKILRDVQNTMIPLNKAHGVRGYEVGWVFVMDKAAHYQSLVFIIF